MKELKLEIKKEYKYKLKKDSYLDFENSFFKDIYDKAWKIFVEIINDSNQEENNNYFSDLEENSGNRIIPFIGERGSGKTSVMFSFAKALLEKEYIKQKINKNFYFESILIDPSLFEENENILEIIVTKLFETFKDKINREYIDEKYEEKKEILYSFEKVYSNIKTIEKKDKFTENDEIVEKISNLGSSSKLKENLKELFCKYLDFESSYNKQKNCSNKKYETVDNKFLLLIIDDFDLNIKNGAEMTEQIRKYLFLPNVIILASINLNDLENLIDKNNSETLEILLKNNFIEKKDINNRSIRYLEKFIPYPRRIFLNEIDKYHNYTNLYLDEIEEKNIFEAKLLDLLKVLLIDYSIKVPRSSIKVNEDIEILIKNLLKDIISLFNFSNIDNLISEFSNNKEKIFNLFNKFFIDLYGEANLKSFNDTKEKIYNNTPYQNIITPQGIIDYTIISIEGMLKVKLEEKLFSIIKLKTGLVFISNENSSLIFDTLRELSDLLFMLYDLNSNNRLINVNIFEKFFFDSYIKKNIDTNEKIFKIFLEKPIDSKNYLIIRSIILDYLNTDLEIKNLEINSTLYHLLFFNKELSLKKQENLSFTLSKLYSMLFNKLLLEEKYNNILKLIGDSRNIKYVNNFNYLEFHEFEINIHESYNKLKVFYNNFIKTDSNSLYNNLAILINKIKTDIKNSSIIKKEKSLSEKEKNSLEKELNNILSELESNLDFNDFNLISNYENIKINEIIKKIDRIIKTINSEKKYRLKLLEIQDNIKYFFQIKKIIIEPYYQEYSEKEIKEKIINNKKDFLEVLEWLFYFLKFFSRNESYFMEYKGYINYFDKMIKSFKNIIKPIIEFTNQKQKFNFSDILSFEFFVYNSEDFKIYMENPFEKDVSNWNDNYFSMNKKIQRWKDKGFISAIPFYSFDILENILLDEAIINFYVTSNNEHRDLSIKLPGFYYLIHDRILDYNNLYIRDSLKESPLFSPFLKGDLNNIYKNMFKFVFSDLE